MTTKFDEYSEMLERHNELLKQNIELLEKYVELLERAEEMWKKMGKGYQPYTPYEPHRIDPNPNPWVVTPYIPRYDSATTDAEPISGREHTWDLSATYEMAWDKKLNIWVARAMADGEEE